MHDDGEASGERDAGFPQAASLGDLERPALQREALARPRQDRVGRFLEQLADRSVALLGDAPGPVKLAGLMPARNEAEVSARRSRSLEPACIIDGSGERS